MATDIEAPGSEGEELIAALSVLGGVKNVKGYGAVGDGVVDDSAAIQAAVDDAASPYSSANRGIVFFPPGTYNVGSTAITYTGNAVKYIEFIGAPGAHISGAVASDALLKRVVDSPYNGIVNIRNLRFTNSHTTGKAITIHSAIGAVVSGCHISAFIGVETYNSQAVTIEHCNIVRDGGTTLAGSIGIMAGNATSVLNCDVVSYQHGIRHYNAGLTVIGGRYEVNTVGIVVGQNSAGSTENSSSVLIAGCSMEQNNTAIYIVAASRACLSGVGSGAGTSQFMDYGLYINGGDNIAVVGCGFSATETFSGSGIRVVTGTNISFMSTSAQSWDVSAIESVQYINCSNTLPTYANLPTAAVPGTIIAITDGNGVSIGSEVSSGGGSTDYVLCRGASAWVRIA
jgi:hypothetical protein